MIVVDSSVWIDYLRNERTDQVRILDASIGREPIVVGDLVLCEVLQGLQSESEARRVEAALRDFVHLPMLDPELAMQAAANYRQLRRLGVTVRKTIDIIIGTFCIERNHMLLHDDRDFDPMQRHLGLRVVA